MTFYFANSSDFTLADAFELNKEPSDRILFVRAEDLARDSFLLSKLNFVSLYAESEDSKTRYSLDRIPTDPFVFMSEYLSSFAEDVALHEERKVNLMSNPLLALLVTNPKLKRELAFYFDAQSHFSALSVKEGYVSNSIRFLKGWAVLFGVSAAGELHVHAQHDRGVNLLEDALLKYNDGRVAFEPEMAYSSSSLLGRRENTYLVNVADYVLDVCINSWSNLIIVPKAPPSEAGYVDASHAVIKKR